MLSNSMLVIAAISQPSHEGTVQQCLVRRMVLLLKTVRSDWRKKVHRNDLRGFAACRVCICAGNSTHLPDSPAQGALVNPYLDSRCVHGL